MELKPTINNLQKLTKALKALQSPKKDLSDYKMEEGLRRARMVVVEINFEELIRSLAEEENAIKEKIAASLQRRRENLLKAAQGSGMPYKRFGEYDRVGPFKISYKSKRVQIEIGSEQIAEIEEAEGEKVFENIVNTLTSLENEPFDRENFFKTFKDALTLAENHGQLDREGWVPIQFIYAKFVLLRHLYIDDFIKKPEKNRFRKYSKAQFLYDLARFGRKGWFLGDEILRSRTPNMATVAAGKAMIIPDLISAEGFGNQVAVMKIEKRAI